MLSFKYKYAGTLLLQYVLRCLKEVSLKIKEKGQTSFKIKYHSYAMWSCNIIVRKYTEFVPSETPKFIIDEKCFEIKKIIIFVLVDYLEIIIILLLKESLYKNQGFDSTSFTFTFAKELSLNLYHDNNTILLRQKIFI